ncbi:MAG: hypothetical protein ABI629_19515 [bacterium]
MAGIRCALALTTLCLASAMALADDPPAWPRTFTQGGNQLVLYQPQLDTWANRLVFAGRVAAVVTPQGGSATSGVLQITASTDTDASKRTVALNKIQMTGAQFPTAAPAAATQATALAKALLPPDGLTLSLDNLLAALVQAGQNATSVALNTTPPTILVAGQPSRLVQFDGAPTFASVGSTTVQHAINTNWPLLRTTDATGYYLLDAGGWLESDALETGEWQYTSQLPAAFSQLPDTQEWQDVREHVPASPSEGQPPLQVYLSTTPAELIVMVGEPKYAQIPGTGISSITNTDSLVFWDGYASAFYYLVAGRWFTATALTGPWTYATSNLPADLAKIPSDSALAAVLPSVPNTPEAREAALQAQIPHLATVDRKSATASVTYDGTPQFAPIVGTSLSYAVNTGNDVIRVGDSYYLCQHGVWFVASSPGGPWSVAASVPDPIYSIPPSSPLYNVTYVRVYQADDTSVVDGYSDGYLGEYVADGVVTWGTGYYYPPYLAVGTLPYYYPRPYTYGCDAYYNPLNGRFHRAGYGYGPYGGIAAGAGYNPATGAYTRGVAAAGPYQSGAAVQAYNPRTATYAAGAEHANPYASWDQGVVYGPSAAARVGAVSDDRGSAARVQTSGGVDAVAATNGEHSAAVVRSPMGDWYAGGDGNVYAHTGDGWQRYGAPGSAEVVENRPVESHPVPPGQYVPSHYVPSYRPDENVSRGLDQAYAARQRETMMTQRYSGWGQRDFRSFGGGRYSGISRGGGGGRGGGGRR